MTRLPNTPRGLAAAAMLVATTGLVPSALAAGPGAAPAAAVSTPAPAVERDVNYRLAGRIAAVEDGDTVTLETRDGTRFRIRLSDIDTPEVYDEAQPNAACACAGRPERLGQPRGTEAGRALRAWAEGRPATAACYSIDRFGRPICHVAVDGRDLSLEQARAGWAWVSERPEWLRRVETRAAVEEARASRRGLWADAEPLAPWTWRRGCWDEGHCPGAIRPESSPAAGATPR